MTKSKLAVALLFVNLGVFFIASAFLPQYQIYEVGSLLERYIKERDHWDIAFGLTLGTSYLSSAVFLLVGSRLKNND